MPARFTSREAEAIAQKKWNSLSDLRDYLVNHTDETLVSFNGYELTTKRNIYTLSLGELTVRERR